MHNKFLELVSSPLMNLDHTYRYSGTKLVEAESLSQHIVDTIMMGLKIIDTVNSLAGYDLLDSSLYLMKAVYHDLEEVITGDIPRPVKYYSNSTRDSLKDVADKVARNLFDKEFPDTSKYHYDVWNQAKEGQEGYILKIVDTLVVAYKVIKEVSLLHNSYMLRVAHEVVQYLREQSDYLLYSTLFEREPQAREYILELIEGSIESMEEILEENKKCMDDLNIYGQSMI